MNGLTFSREHRLTRRSEFVHCYDEGKKYFSKNFVLFVIERDDVLLPWRLGMAVTKKTGSAVCRNRVRRLLRECFRLWQNDVPAGYDVVVIPKRSLNPTSLNLAAVAQDLVPFFNSRWLATAIKGRG